MFECKVRNNNFVRRKILAKIKSNFMKTNSRAELNDITNEIISINISNENDLPFWDHIKIVGSFQLHSANK